MLLRKVAEAEGIPSSFLAKVLQKLAKEGLLRSSKGPGGGFALGRPASSISVREVVDAVDGLTAIESCCMGLDACKDEEPCPLHEAWSQVQERIFYLIDNTTLEDLAKGGPKAAVLKKVASAGIK
jgi:Rrf2 family protein